MYLAGTAAAAVRSGAIRTGFGNGAGRVLRGSRGWIRLLLGWTLLLASLQPGSDALRGVAATAMAGQPDGRAADAAPGQLAGQLSGQFRAASLPGSVLLAPERDDAGASGSSASGHGGGPALAAHTIPIAAAARRLGSAPFPPRRIETGILESLRIPTGPPA